MSEEPTPPPLRLRPRKRDDEQAAVPPAPTAAPVETWPPAAQSPVPAPVESASEVAPLRFRLKPRLSSEPETIPVATETASVPPSMPPPVAGAPAPDEGATEMPRLKLKPLSGVEVATRVAAASASMNKAVVPPPLPLLTVAPEMPAFPVVQPPAPPPLPSAGAVPPPLPPIKAPPVVVPAPYKANAPVKSSKSTMVLAGMLVLLLIAGAGGYFFLFAANEPEPAAAPAPVAAPDPGPVPGPVAPKVVPPPVPIEPLPPPPAPFQAVPGPEAAATPAKPLKPVVTPVFRAWVSDVRVSGVRSGSSTLAIINGRIARPGDIVDAAEGIVFDGVDDKRKALIFRSRNGALLEKTY
jgi:hypothetical protein